MFEILILLNVFNWVDGTKCIGKQLSYCHWHYFCDSAPFFHSLCLNIVEKILTWLRLENMNQGLVAVGKNSWTEEQELVLSFDLHDRYQSSEDYSRRMLTCQNWESGLDGWVGTCPIQIGVLVHTTHLVAILHDFKLPLL